MSDEYAICVATFYEDFAERLVNGAIEAFDEHGISPASVHTFEVPGAFELPLAAKWAAESGRFAGVACLGVVIRGETTHYDYVCGESARGIQDVQLEDGRTMLVRGDHRREPRAGRGPRRRRQARPGPKRRARGDADGQGPRLDRGLTVDDPSQETAELKWEQAKRADQEREMAESAELEDETAQHERRASKAAYLRDKLAQRERAERDSDD